MRDNVLQLRKALNKAFLKVKPNRENIESFKTNLIKLLDQINVTESEEFHKNLVSDFLKNTYYSPNHFINTRGHNDLVIHNGKDAKSNVGVILEVKKPTNKGEMLKVDNLNTKAFQELVLYFLRNRVAEKNLEIRHIVATNIYEWFIFDAAVFEQVFAHNRVLVKQFTDFAEGRMPGKTTDFFYKHIAEPAIAQVQNEILFTHFDIRDYEGYLRNAQPQDDRELIALFKLLAPEHLLKLPFANDSNSLDKTFYSELLHIIGLTETKEGGKKLIGRKREGERNTGSLVENAINQLDSLDKIGRLEKPAQFGDTYQDRLFNVGLELAITWINRILFLKLLEAQLIKYHKNDKSLSFLSLTRIRGYDDLNSLFFSVLARKQSERNESIKKVFAAVPYLNSSLFEPTDLEQLTIFISNLRDENLPISASTVLKDNRGKKRTGDLNGLEYLFEFLNAYDFSSEGSEAIQEENKTLINASVLGLIFEKINGYKDGSFFTPGFVTMYMSRETIRRAVVQKFNAVKGWNCQNIAQLYDRITDKKEANEIINSLKICDPAVGSGHFLVSVLNELIAIKSELKILLDREGRTLRDYHVEVVNDELIVTTDDNELFEYNPKNRESQRIQETLFHEKQIIIENCLFGVDINPNSVKICRLRLWIELLKNAYYKAESNYTELETLPNIDINIKCGNSLISRFPLDADLRQALKKNKSTISSYRTAVQTYRNAQNKEQKRDMEKLINDIKGNLRTEISNNDPKVRKLRRLEAEFYSLRDQMQLFDESEAEKQARNDKLDALEKEINQLTAQIEEIKNNKVYENAFEWRFEFPEVLDDKGDFIGFDVMIGNPPYLGIEDITWDYRRFYETVYTTAKGRFDLYSVFIEKALTLKLSSGVFTFIVPGKFLNNKQFTAARKMICENHEVVVVKIDDKVFDEAQVNSTIIENYLPTQSVAKYKTLNLSSQELRPISEADIELILQDPEVIFRLEINTHIDQLIAKIEQNTLRVKEIGEVKDGIVAGSIKDILFLEQPVDSDSKKLYFGKHLTRYNLSETNIWVNYKPDEMMKEETRRKGEERPGLWMRSEKIFEREKILSRFIAKEVIATYDNEDRYYEHTLHSTHIKDKRFKPKYVLGLYNSSLLKFYYQKKNSEGGNIFPQVRISSVENLPIKIASGEIQDSIETLVDKILSIKKNNPNTDTKILEREVDHLVYQLYALSEEEIKIVERETA